MASFLASLVPVVLVQVSLPVEVALSLIVMIEFMSVTPTIIASKYSVPIGALFVALMATSLGKPISIAPMV